MTKRGENDANGLFKGEEKILISRNFQRQRKSLLGKS